MFWCEPVGTAYVSAYAPLPGAGNGGLKENQAESPAAREHPAEPAALLGAENQEGGR